jgi:hypothetical protein
MVRTDPNPPTRGYTFGPTQAVTAFFPAGRPVDGALIALTAAGFDPDRIDVYTGADGARRIDPAGKTRARRVEFRRALEELFGGDADVFDRADRTLRSGGTVVEVFTRGNLAKKMRAADILKAAGGQDVIYWGPLLTECM